MARRPFTTAPFVLPMSTGTFLKLRRTTIVLVLFVLIVSMSWSSLVWGGKKQLCGIHAPQERQLELQLQAARSDLGQYEEALRQVETSPESTAQTKASARRIRMECGFVRDHGEVVEAVAVQMVAASVKLDAGSAPPVFYAAQAASNKAVDLETLKTGGRFDSRLVLQRLLDQPVSSTPNEFDPSRKIVKSFVDDLSRYRKSWK